MKNLILILFAGLIALPASYGQTEYGMASYYSDKYDGNKTASGEIYKKEDLVGAHKTLPFGTKVKVTRLDNRKTVTVKIIDRGPYTAGRVIDVSRKAAEILDLTTAGVAKVKVEVVEEEAKPTTVSEKPVEKPSITKTKEPAPAEPKVTEAPKKEETNTIAAAATAAKKETVAPKAKPNTNTSSSNAFGLVKLKMENLVSSGYGVQVGSFSEYESMTKTVKNLQSKWFDNILLHTEKSREGEIIYRIILGPWDNEESAQAYKKDLKKKKGIDGFVVSLQGM